MPTTIASPPSWLPAAPMNRFPFFATLIALIAVVILMLRLGRVEKELRTMKQAGAAATAAATPEVAVYMERIQAFSNKLWSAGKAGNLPLAEFYRHEMKEAMEELAKAGIVDDGVNVSEQMEQHGIRTLDRMKAELRTNVPRGLRKTLHPREVADLHPVRRPGFLSGPLSVDRMAHHSAHRPLAGSRAGP